MGYQRTLQASDLWKLDDSRTSAALAEKFEQAYKQRVQEAERWNRDILDGTIHPSGLRRAGWFFRALGSSPRYKDLEDNWRRDGGRRSPSIALALNEVLGTFFWVGGVFKVVADTAQLMCPLLVKVRSAMIHDSFGLHTEDRKQQIIYFAQEREAAKQASIPKPNVGRGIALAIGLFLLTMAFSITQNQVGEFVTRVAPFLMRV